MTDEEIKDMAIETYELGIKMAGAFTNDKNNRDYMIMAIYACITGIVKKPFSAKYIPKQAIDYDGEFFKSLRIEKGYTLRQTEDAIGISNSYLSQFENKKINKPSHNVVTKLLNFYNDGIIVPKSEFTGNLRPVL